MRNILHPLIITLLLVLSHSMNGQTTVTFPDSIKPEQVEHYFTTRADTFHGDTLYEMCSGIYVLKSEAGLWEQRIRVFVRTKKGYNVFNGCPEELAADYSFDTLNFNGTGLPELVISWHYLWSQGGVFGGTTQEYEGLYIWDLTNLDLIYNLQNKTFDIWSIAEFGRDSAGEFSDTIIRSSNGTDCNSWNLTLQKKKIILTWDTNCQPTDESEEVLPPPAQTVYVYELRPSGLVLKK